MIILFCYNGIGPGQTISKTVYLEGKPTPICFINGDGSNLTITNTIENSNIYEQISTFKKSVKLSHIEKTLREPIEKILVYYLDVFNLETELLPCTSLAKHTITLKKKIKLQILNPTDLLNGIRQKLNDKRTKCLRKIS
jgi:hypothetical protein